MNPATKLISARLAMFSLCGLAGYFALGVWLPPHGSAAGRADASSSATKPSSEIIGDPTKSTLVAVWTHLRAQHGRAPADFPALYETVKNESDSYRRDAFRAALLAEWSEADPAGGLTYLWVHDRDRVEHLLREWLFRAPDAAIDAMLTGDRLDHCLRRMLELVVQRAPARVVEVFEKLPRYRDEDSGPRDAYALYARRDFAAARASAEKMRGGWQDEALSAVGRVWAESDPAAALAWATALTDSRLQLGTQLAVLIHSAKTDPVGVLHQIEPILKASRLDFDHFGTVEKFLEKAANRDWDATLAWVRLHPEMTAGYALRGMGKGLVERLKADLPGTMRWLTTEAPENVDDAFQEALRLGSATSRGFPTWGKDAWQWLQQHPEKNRSFGYQLFEWASWTDPEVTAAMLGHLGKNEWMTERISKLVDNMERSDSELRWSMGHQERLESFLGQAAPALRPAVLERCLRSLGALSEAEAKRWAGRLTEIPAEERPRFVPSIAKGWAATAPDAASRWALGLPAAQEREAAFAECSRIWVEVDPRAASAFFETLPPGAEHDLGLENYAATVTHNQPARAWERGLEIQNANRREIVLKRIYARWRWSEPEAAAAARKAAFPDSAEAAPASTPRTAPTPP